MKKLILYSIPVVILVFFVLVMNSGAYLKKPVNESDDVMGYLEIIRANVKNGEWDDAYENAGKLEHAWNKVVPRIQFSVERDEINGLSRNIARLRGAVAGEDKSGALVELAEVQNYWHNLER